MSAYPPALHPIVIAESAMFGVAVDGTLSRSQSPRLRMARQSAAFRLWTETTLSTGEIARQIGRRDHATAIAAILAGARAKGRDAGRISELRGGARDIDWTKLAYAAAGWRASHDLTLERAADRAGVGRGEWRKAEQGRSVSSVTLLCLCRTIGLDPLALLPGKAAA